MRDTPLQSNRVEGPSLASLPNSRVGEADRIGQGFRSKGSDFPGQSRQRLSSRVLRWLQDITRSSAGNTTTSSGETTPAGAIDTKTRSVAVVSSDVDVPGSWINAWHVPSCSFSWRFRISKSKQTLLRLTLVVSVFGKREIKRLTSPFDIQQPSASGTDTQHEWLDVVGVFKLVLYL